MQASIGFVNGLGIFDDDYYANVNNSYSQYEIQDLEEFQTLGEETSIVDYFSMMINLTWEGILMVLRIFFAIVIIFPTLVDTFSVPAGISGFLQVGVWVTYYLGWAQWKSGKSFEAIQ